MPELPSTPQADDAKTRREIHRQALSIGLAVAPFGIAFGVICSEAGLSVWEALGFSTLVFAGSSQFAAVTVIADGGTAVAAVIAGLLLNLRSLAFGVAMASALTRAAVVARARFAADDRRVDCRRHGAGRDPLAPVRLPRGRHLRVRALEHHNGPGRVCAGSSEELIHDLGIDATIPAAFLALLWPRLRDESQRVVALAGAVTALVLVPITPAGVPIIAAAAAVVIARPWRESGTDA